MGGGFVYTNKESLSVGLEVSAASLAGAGTRLPYLLEAFCRSAPVRRLLAGARRFEYVPRLVPEAGVPMASRFYGHGILLLGDAAGFSLNLGYTVRGMDHAVTSGMLAGETALEAREKRDYTARTLATYESPLKTSHVLRDLTIHRRAPDFIGRTPCLHRDYHELVADLFTALFTVDGSSGLFFKKAAPLLRRAGMFGLLKDAVRGGRSL